MKPKAHAPALALAALITAGCGGGGSGGDEPVASAPPPPPPPPTSTTTAFTPFVKQQLAITDVAAEPASVNEQEWMFDEDETAYDDVIAASGS